MALLHLLLVGTSTLLILPAKKIRIGHSSTDTDKKKKWPEPVENKDGLGVDGDKECEKKSLVVGNADDNKEVYLSGRFCSVF